MTMATLKSHTDLEQSKKLAEILPLESADMWYHGHCSPIESEREYDSEACPFHSMRPNWDKPSWSLAALLATLPVNIEYKGNSLRLRLDLGEKDFNIWYDNTDNGVESDIDVLADNPIDACVSMILKLHELQLL